MMRPENLPFRAADILLPRGGFEKWAVVACDQFTSQPEYWNKLESEVGDAPSALNLILPEVFLGKGGDEERIAAIHAAMKQYLDAGLFREYKNAMIYVERTLPDGRVRRGIVGAADLCAYDFHAGSRSLIRATEGTVLERIPPRVRVREGAPLELPHVMLLVDDPTDSVFCAAKTAAGGEPLYDFDLTMGGGHLRGYLLDAAAIDAVTAAMATLAGDGEDPVLFAVGDGNHSLATAKTCYENHPCEAARYALTEVVNLHDPALDFEPIYRVVFGADPEKLIGALKKTFASEGEGRPVTWLCGDRSGTVTVPGLTVKTLQEFLDRTLADFPGATIDYIHGEDVVRDLAGKGAVGFVFDGIDKHELFPYIEKNGVLPRKTFSMGEAASKRYYTEAHRIL